MNIQENSKDFAALTGITEPDVVWYDIRQLPFVISGIQYDETCNCYTRIPQNIANTVSEGVATANTYTAGGRVRFRTNSTFIAIYAVMNNVTLWHLFTQLGHSGFDLYRKENGSAERFYNPLCSVVGVKSGFSASCSTDGALTDYTLYFPLHDNVQELYIALKKDAAILAPTPYSNPILVVFYGSSITQGCCASRPGNHYEAIISRRLDTDYINLGFSGSAKGEETIIQYIADLKMRAFVCDYDFNAPDVEHLKKTHMPLYRTIRAKQPDLPIIFISAPVIWRLPDWATRRQVIKETYQTALDEGDKNVYFIDGGELFTSEDWDSCTVDGTHPNDLGFYLMAKCIEKELINI